MKISYAITTHNEIEEVKKLIPFVYKHKKEEDEIVVLDDFSVEEMEEVLNKFYDDGYVTTWQRRKLKRDFAAQKNYAKEMCSGDYIFHLDADEMPNEFLITNLHQILESNDNVDLIWVPRINTVDGLTQKHIIEWNWRVNDKGWINFPDPQARIFRNSEDIKWTSRVHEHIVGCDVISQLPHKEEFCLYHHKSITKQELQNELYGEIINEVKDTFVETQKNYLKES
jgi:glycosyltransferase involved in cell wall biosynthesis